MLRMTVEGVGYDHLRQTVVVLKDWSGQKLLPIWIGTNEARAIAFELDDVKPSRPFSHDLLLNCIQVCGNRVSRVVINDLQDSTFFATIDIDTPRGLKHIDARPSDAIALAVRARCPLFVDGGALGALIEVNEASLEEALPNSSAFDAQGDLDDDLDGTFEANLEPGLDTDLSDDIVPLSPPSGAKDAMDDEVDRFKRLIGDLDV